MIIHVPVSMLVLQANAGTEKNNKKHEVICFTMTYTLKILHSDSSFIGNGEQ